MVYLTGPPPRKVGPASAANRPRRFIAAGERKYGYGDLDDWNALPATDQARIRGHSQNLLRAFRNTKWFLQALGSFPFETKQLEDGSYTFILKRTSFAYIVFFIKSILFAIIFVLFSLGLFSIFVVAQPGRAVHDRCGNTWGKTVLSRNMPAVIFVWTQLTMTAAGNIYVIYHGESFLNFYNYVNEAVMQLDVDPTTGMLLADIRGSIVFSALLIACIVLFATDGLHSLEEVSAFVIQSLIYFFIRDLFSYGEDHFTAGAYEDLLPKCHKECRDCYGPSADEKKCEFNACFNIINHPPQAYKVVKWIGFIIIAYSILGARALIRQFEFFCQVLVNLASVWNKRFLIYASKENQINMDDPYRRRITHQYMLKDHYEIVRLYNETEGNFSFILFVYFTCVFCNLIFQFYYTALLSTQVTCSAAVGREMDAARANLCYVNETLNINNTDDVLNAGLHGFSRTGVNIAKQTASFEDACAIKQVDIISHASITTTILLVVTLSSFIITTIDADRASHQADIGFYRVRKRGYMTCRTKKERAAMHSLVFSFTGPKPFCITAAGYFPIRKKTIVVLTSVAFIYFLIILGFKPGMNKPITRCYNLTAGGRQRYIVEYPKSI